VSDCGCAPELSPASAAAVAPVATGWTRDAGPPAVTRLTTATDQVAMGTATPVVGRKVTVLTTGVNQGMRFTGTAAGDNVLDADVVADPAVRLSLTMTALSWGAGAVAPDTTLQRGGADLLEVATGDTFRIVDGGWRTGDTLVAATPYTVAATDLVLRVGAAGTIDLPSLGAAGADRHLWVVRNAGVAGATVLDPAPGETINGLATLSLAAPQQAAHIYGPAGTTDWRVIA
jgi:hypothetical protein